VAILAAFIVTWLAARTTDSPSMFEMMLRASLSNAAGVPHPYLVGSVAAFLVPASILLAITALVEPAAPKAVMAAVALALLSHGSFDVPLQALLITASAQWALLTMADDRSVSIALPHKRETVSTAASTGSA
jgi:hypothetical protein